MVMGFVGTFEPCITDCPTRLSDFPRFFVTDFLTQERWELDNVSLVLFFSIFPLLLVLSANVLLLLSSFQGSFICLIKDLNNFEFYSIIKIITNQSFQYGIVINLLCLIIQSRIADNFTALFITLSYQNVNPNASKRVDRKSKPPHLCKNNRKLRLLRCIGLFLHA